MQTLTYVAPKRLEWREISKPKLQNGKAALVKPLAVARCDLDYFIAMGHYRTPGPFALGHEIAGEVIDIGDQVGSFQPGDQVIVPFQINCGECANCQRGWTNSCSAVPPYSAFGLGPGFGGGFSNCIHVPFADAMLVKIPQGMTMVAACGLSDNIADAYRTVAHHLQVFPQQPVLIVGGLAKSIGLYAVQAAIACGSSRVVYVDDAEDRLLAAQKLGADIYREDFNVHSQYNEQFLITVDANCSQQGMSYALNSTAACGFCTSVSGGLSPTTALPLTNIYLKGITYQISRVHSRATLPSVLTHVCSGAIDPLAFASEPLPFSAAKEAMFEPVNKLIFYADDQQ